MKAKPLQFNAYHFFRCFHWAIFFGMAVVCGLLSALEGNSQPAHFPMAFAATLCLLIEVCYLAFGRWRVSLAYLLLATTYLALTAGATIAVFNFTRYLLGD